jgi:hypothetical protein
MRLRPSLAAAANLLCSLDRHRMALLWNPGLTAVEAVRIVPKPSTPLKR